VRFDLHETGAQVREHTDLEGVLGELDVLYVTRIQKERFPDENEYHRVAGEYQIDAETLEDAPDDLTVMHPLPRVDEIAPDVDERPITRRTSSRRNGIPVRMALLDILLENAEGDGDGGGPMSDHELRVSRRSATAP